MKTSVQCDACEMTSDGERAGKKKKVEPGKGDHEEEMGEKPEALFARIRPRRRVLFFIGFVGFCLWIMAFYDPCQVESKSRKDCGYKGISPSYCMTGSCFTSRGGKLEKKTIKVDRKKGMKLGIEAKLDDKELALVQSISGAAQQYNDLLPADSPQRIRVGDVVAKVDGQSGKQIMDALSRTSEKLVDIEMRRSGLPNFLMWLRSSSRPGAIETILTAPGFKRWSKLTSQLGTLGFSCWLLSGYGAASLPLWYFGFSATVAYKLVRCCHDEHVSPGVPHCFRPVDQDLAQVVEQAWVSSSAFALKTVDQWRSFGQEVLFASSGQKKKKEKKKKEKGS